MKDILNGLKGMVFLTGIISITGIITSLLYADRKLHETSHGHKYGPARHLLYFADIIHRANREIENAAVTAYSNASKEDALFYDRLQDEHDDNAPGEYKEPDPIPQNGPDPADVINDPIY